MFEGMTREEIIAQFQRTIEADVARKENLEKRIKELEAENRQLRRLIGVDHLTGIPVRYRVMKFLENEIARCRRYDGSTFSVLFLDIDHFRKINENLGHLGGDAVLRELAQRLQAALRRYDAIGRYGGEEFLIVLPNTPGDKAILAAERLREKIVAAKPFVYGDKTVTVTVSIGISQFRREDTAPDLIEAADMAMFRTKDRGRNCVEPDSRP